MPTFSDFEKNIIQGIVDTTPQILGCCISSLMFQSNECALYVSLATNNELSEDPIAQLYCKKELMSEYIRKVITIISLIKYLERNQYICVFPNRSHVYNYLFNEDSPTPEDLTYKPGQVDASELLLQLGNGGTLKITYHEHGRESKILYADNSVLVSYRFEHALYQEIERVFTSCVHPTVRLVELVRANFQEPQEIATAK
jgi:hypothetical protein